MTLKERYEGIIGWFRTHMPEAESELQYKSPYELLVAVILSAQCTDKRVNMTTPALFAAYPTPEAMAAAAPEEIYGYIKSISYPNNKAKNLAAMARGYARFPGLGAHRADARREDASSGRIAARKIHPVAFASRSTSLADSSRALRLHGAGSALCGLRGPYMVPELRTVKKRLGVGSLQTFSYI